MPGFIERQIEFLVEHHKEYEGIILLGFKEAKDLLYPMETIHKFKELTLKPIMLESQEYDPAQILLAILNGIDITESAFVFSLASEYKAININFKDLEIAYAQKAEKLKASELMELGKGKTVKTINVSEIEKSPKESPIINGCKCYTCINHSM